MGNIRSLQIVLYTSVEENVGLVYLSSYRTIQLAAVGLLFRLTMLVKQTACISRFYVKAVLA